MKKFVIDGAEASLLKQLVDESISEWENAVGMDIWESDEDVIVSSAYSGNNIRWSTNFAMETGYDPQNTLAVTIRYNEGMFIGKTEIILNGELPYLRQNFSKVLKKTLLHELGHTIGLDHSTEEAIMAPYIGAIQELQYDDIEGGIAVTNETVARQSPSHIEALKKKEAGSDGMGSCGTVTLIDSDKKGPPPFLPSVILGIFLAFLLQGKSAVRKVAILSGLN